MKTKFFGLIFLFMFAMVGVSFADHTPPGLSGKAMPHGLSKQNKTPAGWSKGEKRGWNKHHKFHHHHYRHHHNHGHNIVKDND